MATYMTVYHLSADNRNEAIARFLEGTAMQPPEGVTHVARWHSAGGGIGWGVADTDDPKLIADWLMQWSDIIEYEIYPVISDEEFGEIMVKHGHGG